MYPRDALLGRIDGRDGFYNLHRAPDARPVPGLTFSLMQGGLLFYRADYVGTRLAPIVGDLGHQARWFVLDASAVIHVRSTGAAMLAEFLDRLDDCGFAFGIAELHAEAPELLERSSLVDRIGPTMLFDDLKDALTAFRRSDAA